MKKRFTEEQIIGFLREAEAGPPLKELCRRHGYSEASNLSPLEALVRMIDEENPEQLIMPGLFIPIAEKTGKILELDRWVIREAIAILTRHPKLLALAVNLSGRSLASPSLPQFIEPTLIQQGVTPSRLLIEITETTAIGDLQDAGRFIQALTMAEFVEDAATLALLTQFGVDLVQGYFLDLPFAKHPALQGGEVVFPKKDTPVV